MPGESSRGATNRGIQQYAGTMHVGVQAVGDNARAQARNVHLGDPISKESIMDMLVTVRSLIKQHQDSLPEPNTALVTAEILSEELGQDKPNKPTVARLLARLVTLASSVAPVAKAVTEIAKAVHATLGI